MIKSKKTAHQLKKERAQKMYLDLHTIKKLRRDYVLDKICQELFYSLDRLKRVLPLAECEEMEKEYLENITINKGIKKPDLFGFYSSVPFL